MTDAVNPISLSIAPATAAIGRRYDDLSGTMELMERLWQESVLDGFEFQNLAEWDASGPPRDEADKGLATREASLLGEALNPVCSYPAIWPMAGRAE